MTTPAPTVTDPTTERILDVIIEAGEYTLQPDEIADALVDADVDEERFTGCATIELELAHSEYAARANQVLAELDGYREDEAADWANLKAAEQRGRFLPLA